MPNKTILTAVVVAFLLLPLTTTLASNGLQQSKVPDALDPELDYLLSLITPDNEDTFDLERIQQVLNFVAAPKRHPVLYYAKKKFGAHSAYY